MEESSPPCCGRELQPEEQRGSGQPAQALLGIFHESTAQPWWPGCCVCVCVPSVRALLQGSWMARGDGRVA